MKNKDKWDFGLPPESWRAISDALQQNKLALFVVVSDAVIERLAANQSASITLDNGGVILMTPEKLAREHYEKKGEPK